MGTAKRIVRPKTEREKAAANFVLKGALTRLALMFHGSRKSFTGEEVATILIAVIPRQKLDDNTPEQPTPTLTAGRDPEPVLCEEERRKEKD